MTTPRLTTPSRPGSKGLPVLLASLLVMLAAAVTIAPPADAAKPLTFRKVATAEQPTALTFAPGLPKLVYVVERKGKIRVMKQGKWLPRPLLNISKLVNTRWIEQGLLGLAFPPDFLTTRRYYIHYVARNGDVMIAEYRTMKNNPTRTSPGSRRPVLRIPHVNNRGNHNGGAMHFLGNNLYISVGDGNDPGDQMNLAQNLESLRGKILRIDPRLDLINGRTYRIPAGNPFVDQPGRDEIFAYGFRNPHSFQFNRLPSDQLMMTITDVGQERYEELNYLPLSEARGGNFGWHQYEGLEPFDCGELCPGGGPPTITTGLTWPQLTYSHDDGCAIIGGPVVTDPSLPSIKGRIIYGDFCANRIRSAAPETGTITDDKPTGIFLPPGEGKHSALNAFGVDGWGRVFALSNFGGVYVLLQTHLPG